MCQFHQQSGSQGLNMSGTSRLLCRVLHTAMAGHAWQTAASNCLLDSAASMSPHALSSGSSMWGTPNSSASSSSPACRAQVDASLGQNAIAHCHRRDRKHSAAPYLHALRDIKHHTAGGEVSVLHRGGVVACRCRCQVQQRCRPHSHDRPLTAAVFGTQCRACHAAHDQGRPATWEVLHANYLPKVRGMCTQHCHH